MTILSNLLALMDSFLGNPWFLIGVLGTSTILKTAFAIFLLTRITGNNRNKLQAFLLSLVLISSGIGDLGWVLFSFKSTILPQLSFLYTIYIRLSWAFSIVQYQALSLFIESLCVKKYRLSIRQRIFLTCTTIMFLSFLSTAVYGIVTQDSRRFLFEYTMMTATTLFALFPLMLSSLFIAIISMRNRAIPTLVLKQLALFIYVVIIPYWVSDFLQVFPFSITTNWLNESYTFVVLSNILLIIAVFYCTRRIMGLRFLNFKNHVQAKPRLSFLNDFKSILEQLSIVGTIPELQHLVQNFFKTSLEVPLGKAGLYIRKVDDGQETMGTYANTQTPGLVDLFMTTHAQSMCDFLYSSKILIYDEISFSNFYEEIPERTQALQFLDTINADIFVPIYEKNKLIAYIVVDRFARPHQFYSDVERDEILVLTSYLGNIINLMRNKNFDVLVRHERELREELYRKHQEINQYKESIRSFMRSNKQKAIGILFYKNRHFSFANQTARELIAIDPNRQEGHPLSRALRSIGQAVEQFHSAQTLLAKNNEGNTIVLSGVPSLERNNVIITVSYPEISDVLKKQIELLKDPSEWDYLLYLETTQKGKLINQLIPGEGQNLVSFKIELLKIALSKKAILFDLPDEDLLPTVELLHHIDFRETLHVLDLKPNSDDHFEIAILLLGINPLFGKSPAGRPLLEELDQKGTLFIKNIHRLHLETQKYLAEYLRYGYFRLLKSEQRVASSVRIFCSSNKKLHTLMQEGKFDKDLFEELKHTTLSMPSLMTLPEEELSTLAHGFSEQAINNQTLKNLLELTETETHKLINKRPASLQELKFKVQHLLVQKSKNTPLSEDEHFDPAYTVTDPDLVQAARLGKYALKDRKILSMLWDKFKNQNKIAQFLGVNRSSVSRRCKDFDLK